MPSINLGLDVPADREIVYQPDYWSDRAEDIRRLADALREQPEFYAALNRQAEICDCLARRALTLKQKRANYMRAPPKYFFRVDTSISDPGVIDLNQRRKTGG